MGQRTSWIRVSLAAVVALSVSAAGIGSAAAQSRGQGTMLVRQDIHCAGSGNASAVYLPFALYFTGFAPNTTGTIAAYTQPGGRLIGSADIILDSRGNRCVEVSGHADAGQYKIVYDFGSGTGKQKVIRLIDPPGTAPTATPSHPIATVTPTPTSASPSTTSASPSTTTASPSTTSASPTDTSTSSGVPSSGGDPTDSAPDFVFAPEALAPTGASMAPLSAGAALTVVGLVLILMSRRGSAHSISRKH